MCQESRPSVLPLTTRGRRPPSFWTHLSSLHTPLHPLITFPAVPHHHGLLIQLTPATLPVGIKRLCTCVCLHRLVWLPVTAIDYVRFLYIVLFFACWHFCSLIKSLICNWTQISIFPRASSLSRDIMNNIVYFIL